MASYTELTKKDFREILSKYNIVYENYKSIQGGMANTSFQVNGSYTLTVLDNHDVGSATRLAQTMRYLNANGFNTPEPIADVNGNDILIFKERPIILKPYLDITNRPTPELERATGVGQLLAKLHKLPQPVFLNKFGRRIPNNAEEVLEQHDCDDLKASLSRIKTFEFENIFKDYPLTLCHGDLMGDNVLELPNKQLIAIDWETLTIDCTILDLGISAVSAVKRGESVDQFADNLLEGYSSLEPEVTPEHKHIVQVAAYCCGLMAYHRFVRQSITFPNPSNKYIYRALLPFIEKTL